MPLHSPASARISRPLRPVLAIVLIALIGTPTSLSGQAADTIPAQVSLQEAIDRALLYAPAAVAARLGTENAGAAVREASGDFLPTATLGSAFTNSSNQRFDQTTGQLVSESYSARASANYEVFSFGRRFANRRAANARLDAALATEKDQGFQVALTTTQIYFDVAAARELLGVADQRIERAQAGLEAAEIRLELGTVTRSDVLRAELELSNAELARLDAEVALRTGALRLGRQIGVSGQVMAQASALPRTVPELLPVDALIAMAEAGAPPVLAAEASVSDGNAQRLSLLTRYAPSISVSGGYDWFAFTFPPNQESWSMRVTASLPIFDGFAREAGLQRNEAQRRLAEARYRDAVIGARVDVEGAVLRIEAARSRVSIADRGRTLAEEDLRVQAERYQLGVSTILDLQTSQVALADAENAWVLERQNLGLALAQLETVLGLSLEDIVQ
jgi:outer membrane protein TolC